MAINLDRMVNLHHSAVKVREQKMEVIAGNLAEKHPGSTSSVASNFTSPS